MSRRDYILVAEIIRGLPLTTGNRDEVVKDFVKGFKTAHPTFNAEAFRKACGAR